ncbi:hypothetical protein V9Z28_03430 [Streptococcus suis]|uniref:hypothetical protein n=1 Tax=Streptococcus suis TaxID=1307 RepID=UPI00301057A2
MEIVRKWLFRISTGDVENLPISHEDDESEVNEFINDIINEIQRNKSTKQYRTRTKTNEVIANLNGLYDVALLDEKFIEHANLQLTNVAKRLAWVEKDVNTNYGHLNKIQKGELLLVLLRDEEEQTDKFLLSKVEVVPMLKTDDISIARGIIKEVKSLWKSCLFTLEEIQDEDGDNYYLADVYSSTNSTYWHHRFLELDEMTSDETNTKRSFNAIDKLLGKEIKKYFKRDHEILRNAVVQYYRRGGKFDYYDMISEVFESYAPEHALFSNDVKKELIKKLEDLPTKKSSRFDTIFISVHSVLNVRIKKIFPLRTGLNLVITDGIDNIQDVIQAKEDSRNGKQLIIYIDDQDTFDSFKKPTKVNEI